MNVLFISSFAGLYGANKSLIDMITGFDRSIVNVKVICQAEGDFTDRLKKEKIDYKIIPFKNNIGKRKHFFKGIVKVIINWILVLRWFYFLKRFQPNIVHTNSSVTFFGCYVAFMLRAPHVWHIREFLKQDYGLNYQLGYRYFRFWIKKTSLVIFISQKIKEVRMNSIDNIKNIVINDGFLRSNDIIALSQLRGKILQREEIRNFCVVGKIIEGKNQLEAVRAFKILTDKYTNIKLLLIGNGDANYIKSIESFIQEHDLINNVSLIGNVKDVESYYDKSDVLIMCSKDEGLGRVTIEAMSRGVIVIGYNSAGTAEIITNKDNGFLYTGDFKSLATHIEQLLSTDAYELHEIAVRSLNLIKNKFIVENYVSQVLKEYANLIEK